MHYVELAAIAKAVEALRSQLPTNDQALRSQLANTLIALREMANQTLDAWMSVDEIIEETYALLDPTADDPSVSETDGEAYTAANPWDTNMDSPFREGLFHLTLAHEGQIRKGLAYYDLRMYDHAANALTEVAGKIRGGGNVETMIYLALSHLHAHRLEEAKTALSEAQLAADPKDEIVSQAILEVRTQLCAEQGDWHQAIHSLYDLLDTNADEGDIWFNLGICHTKLLEFSAAERCFAQSFSKKEDTEALLWRGLVLSWSGNVQQAVEIAHQLSGLTPDKTHNYANEIRPRVLLYLSTGAFEHARNLARACQNDGATLALGLHLEAFCFAAIGYARRASTLCKRVLTLMPNDTESASLLGICLYLDGELERSARILRSVTRVSPPSPGIVDLLLGRMAILSNDPNRASTYLRRASSSAQLTVRRLAALYQAVLHERQADSEQLQAALHRAIKLGLPAELLGGTAAHQ